MYLAGYSPASCHAGSREVIPVFLLWAGQVSSCGPTPKFWQHSEQTHSFQGQFQLLPTWEANNIAERSTCIQLNAHNILLWESGCFRSVKTHSYTPFCGVIRYSDDFIQMSMIKYINRRFVFNYPGNGYLTFIPSLLHFYSVIAQIHFWKGSAL